MGKNDLVWARNSAWQERSSEIDGLSATRAAGGQEQRSSRAAEGGGYNGCSLRSCYTVFKVDLPPAGFYRVGNEVHTGK